MFVILLFYYYFFRLKIMLVKTNITKQVTQKLTKVSAKPDPSSDNIILPNFDWFPSNLSKTYSHGHRNSDQIHSLRITPNYNFLESWCLWGEKLLLLQKLMGLSSEGALPIFVEVPGLRWNIKSPVATWYYKYLRRVMLSERWWVAALPSKVLFIWGVCDCFYDFLWIVWWCFFFCYCE